MGSTNNCVSVEMLIVIRAYVLKVYLDKAKIVSVDKIIPWNTIIGFVCKYV